MHERYEILHIKSMLSYNKKSRNLVKKIAGGFCKTFLKNPMHYLFSLSKTSSCPSNPWKLYSGKKTKGITFISLIVIIILRKITRLSRAAELLVTSLPASCYVSEICEVA